MRRDKFARSWNFWWRLGGIEILERDSSDQITRAAAALGSANFADKSLGVGADAFCPAVYAEQTCAHISPDSPQNKLSRSRLHRLFTCHYIN